jgi:hypothetical protein
MNCMVISKNLKQILYGDCNIYNPIGAEAKHEATIKQCVANANMRLKAARSPYSVTAAAGVATKSLS